MKIDRLGPELAKDLIELINDLGKLPKTASVKYGSTEFKYVPLDDMLAKVKANTNFAFMQPLGMLEDGTPCIQCLLVHKSGKTIVSDPYRLVVHPNDKKQMEGAEITYSRRYSMASFFGIASDEDTDATTPQQQPPKKEVPTQQPPKKNISNKTGQVINDTIRAYSQLSNKNNKEIIQEVERIIHKNLKAINEKEAESVLGYLYQRIDDLSNKQEEETELNIIEEAGEEEQSEV